jgi:hypothetical protein
MGNFVYLANNSQASILYSTLSDDCLLRCMFRCAHRYIKVTSNEIRWQNILFYKSCYQQATPNNNNNNNNNNNMVEENCEIT